MEFKVYLPGETCTMFELSEDQYKFFKEGQVWVVRGTEYNKDYQKPYMAMQRVDYAK